MEPRKRCKIESYNPNQIIRSLEVDEMRAELPIVSEEESILTAVRSNDSDVSFVTGSPGCGKCWSRGTRFLTFKRIHQPGLKNCSEYGVSEVAVENIKPGQLLVGDDGYPRRVVSTISSFDDMFLISPKCKSVCKGFTCNSEHILVLKLSSSTYHLCKKSCFYKNGLGKGEVWNVPHFVYSAESNTISFEEERIFGDKRSALEFCSTLPNLANFIWEIELDRFLTVSPIVQQNCVLFRPRVVQFPPPTTMYSCSSSLSSLFRVFPPWLLGLVCCLSWSNRVCLVDDHCRRCCCLKLILHKNIQSLTKKIVRICKQSSIMAEPSINENALTISVGRSKYPDLKEFISKNNSSISPMVINTAPKPRSLFLKGIQNGLSSSYCSECFSDVEFRKKIFEKVTNLEILCRVCGFCVAEEDFTIRPLDSFSTPFSVVAVSRGQYFGFCLSSPLRGSNRRVLLSDCTITHNTTQVPQFLYEEMLNAGEFNANPPQSHQCIGITQPRRIAASSMAERVHFELGGDVGHGRHVGYLIRNEARNLGEVNRVKFVTDGILLKEIQGDFALRRYRFIIIDEAHERSLNTDLLLSLLSKIVIVRRSLSPKIPPLRVVVMSATLDIDRISHLFPNAPHVHVQGRMFPVTVHFNRRTPDDYVSDCVKKIVRIHKTLPAGTILCFLSSRKEVDDACKSVEKKLSLDYDNDDNDDDDDEEEEEEEEEKEKEKEEEQKQEQEPSPTPPRSSTSNVLVLPLYASLPRALQQRVFQPPSSDTRVIVIATNVAETSLTLPSVRYVVDSGKVKAKRLYPGSDVQYFSTEWVSISGCEQRAGRAGRMMHGHVYRIFSSNVFATQFEKYPVSESGNSSLLWLVLYLKSFNVISISKFPLPSPSPPKTLLESAESELLAIQCLFRKFSSSSSSSEGQQTLISDLGKKSLSLPLSPRFAKLLVLGMESSSLRFLLPHVINLVAICSVRELFVSPESQKKCIFGHRDSDLLTYIHLFGALKHELKDIDSVAAKSKMTSFCSSHGLNPRFVLEAWDIRLQLISRIRKSVSDGNENRFPESFLRLLDGGAEAVPSAEFERIFRQFALSGFVDKIARRTTTTTLVSLGGGGGRKVAKFLYRTANCSELVLISPKSALFPLSPQPDWVMFRELWIGSRSKIPAMVDVTVIEPEWIAPAALAGSGGGGGSDVNASNLISFEAPMVSKESPKIHSDSISVIVRPSLIAKANSWDLPLIRRLLSPSIPCWVEVVAYCFVSGQLFPKLKPLASKMIVKSDSLLLSIGSGSGSASTRFAPLLRSLRSRKICSASDITRIWDAKKNKKNKKKHSGKGKGKGKKNTSDIGNDDENWLLAEYLLLFIPAMHSQLKESWPPR